MEPNRIRNNRDFPRDGDVIVRYEKDFPKIILNQSNIRVISFSIDLIYFLFLFFWIIIFRFVFILDKTFIGFIGSSSIAIAGLIFAIPIFSERINQDKNLMILSLIIDYIFIINVFFVFIVLGWTPELLVLGITVDILIFFGFLFFGAMLIDSIFWIIRRKNPNWRKKIPLIYTFQPLIVPLNFLWNFNIFSIIIVLFILGIIHLLILSFSLLLIQLVRMDDNTKHSLKIEEILRNYWKTPLTIKEILKVLVKDKYNPILSNINILNALKYLISKNRISYCYYTNNLEFDSFFSLDIRNKVISFLENLEYLIIEKSFSRNPQEDIFRQIFERKQLSQFIWEHFIDFEFQNKFQYIIPIRYSGDFAAFIKKDLDRDLSNKLKMLAFNFPNRKKIEDPEFRNDLLENYKILLIDDDSHNVEERIDFFLVIFISLLTHFFSKDEDFCYLLALCNLSKMIKDRQKTEYSKILPEKWHEYLLEFSEKSGNKWYILISYIKLAIFKLEIHNFKDAMVNLVKGIDIIKEFEKVGGKNTEIGENIKSIKDLINLSIHLINKRKKIIKNTIGGKSFIQIRKYNSEWERRKEINELLDRYLRNGYEFEVELQKLNNLFNNIFQKFFYRTDKTIRALQYFFK